MFLRLAFVFILSLFFGCGFDNTNNSGGLAISTSVNALSSSDVVSVSLVYTQTSGGSYSGSVNLTPSGGVAQTLLSPLPSGVYSITATAKSSTNITLYSGISSVTVDPNATTSLVMLLQQTGPSTFYGYAPVISSFTFNPANPVPNQPVSAHVNAMYSGSGGITYNWSASCSIPGSTTTIATPTSSTTNIISNCSGVLTVQAAVNGGGNTSVASTTLNYSVQAIDISIYFNTFPTITITIPDDGQITAGETTSLVATASDSDGDALSYQWSIPTSGNYLCPSAILANDTTNTVDFTAPTTIPPSGRCRIVLTVSDGKGGQATAQYEVSVSALN